MDISIIIPAKDEAQNIARCLESIFRQKVSFSFEVMVIDSGSSDNTTGIVRLFPGVKLVEIPPETFGHGRTRNLGAEMTTGDVIIYLNADAIPVDDRWLYHLAAPLLDGPDKDLAGVFSRHLPKTNCHLYMVRDLLKSMPGDRPEVRTHASVLDFMVFSTVSCAIRRDLWRSDPFQDDILIAEDQQWARRILEKGYKILYQPASMVYHSHNYSTRELYRVKQRVGLSEDRFKNRFNAVISGFILALAGWLSKVAGDIAFILLPGPRKMPLKKKLKETGTALKARTASFMGRYSGWKKNE